MGHEIGDVSIGVGNWPDKSPSESRIEVLKETLKKL